MVYGFRFQFAEIIISYNPSYSLLETTASFLLVFYQLM